MPSGYRKRKQSPLTTRRSGACCIIPPHMLREIAVHGEAADREWAARTLKTASQICDMRPVLALIPPSPGKGKKLRIVYDTHRTEDLPGTAVRREGEKPLHDMGVDSAYGHAGTVYDFYSSVFERDSIDGKGMPIDVTVHYGKAFANTVWNGRQMVHGDSDGSYFRDFTSSLDAAAHEATHGVIQFASGLEYHDQPGALNESFADIFASLIRQWKRQQTAGTADWLIGADLVGPKFNGEALRSLKAPGEAYDDPVIGRDPQPAAMKGYVTTTFDNGGVHINSGIPNRAFYLAATSIGGNAWEKAGRIWYIALHRLHPDTDFQHAAAETITVAGELYGGNGLVHRAVVEAWQEVGVIQNVFIPLGKKRTSPQK